jgi:hypothetical protein
LSGGVASTIRRSLLDNCRDVVHRVISCNHVLNEGMSEITTFISACKVPDNPQALVNVSPHFVCPVKTRKHVDDRHHTGLEVSIIEADSSETHASGPPFGRNHVSCERPHVDIKVESERKTSHSMLVGARWLSQEVVEASPWSPEPRWSA